MNEHEVDLRLRALFDDPLPAADPAFSDRVVALAAYEQSVRLTRRRMARRITSETLALVAVLVTFTLLARAAPMPADLGDTVPLASPAMLGLTMLALWAMVGLRPAIAGR